MRVAGITKHFGKVLALDNVDLEIRSGDAVALWGPNGAGKTTLLRCLLGILRFEGKAEVLGLDVKKQGKEVRRSIGYVAQEMHFHMDQTVWETIGFYARLRKVPLHRAQQLISEWGLEAAKEQHAHNLSGGMKQKLSLAIALLSDPPVLFLDEPMSNLDVQTRCEFDMSLGRLKKAGKTLVFCSHRHTEVKTIADRVIVLEAGVKKSDGRPAALAKQLGRQVMLRLAFNDGDVSKAAEYFTQRGMTVQRNGSEIWVLVDSDRKAEIIALLLQASIPVVDFET